MIPFIILLFVPIAISPFVRSIKINRIYIKNLPLFLFFLILTFLIMFRNEKVGADTANYLIIFENNARMNWSAIGKDTAEIGFQVLNKLLALISTNHHFYIAVMGLLVSALIYPTYRRVSNDAALTIALFCTMSTFVMMFSGIRQMLAVGLGFIAYEFTRNKKLVFFILTVVLAVLFHTSAFIIALMYPLYHIKIKRKWMFFVVPVLLAVFVFNKPIFSFLTAIAERFTNYQGTVTSTGAYTMIVLFIFFAVFSYVIPDENLLDSETIGLRNFLLLALVLQMFAPLNVWTMRMNYYFIIFIPLLIPKIIESSSVRWNQFAKWGRNIMIVFFLGYFLVNAIFRSNNLNVFPYHFFWENPV